MEVKNADKFMIAVVLTEFLACVPLELAYNLNPGALAASLMLFVMITIVGEVSGGHLNPAVTLAVYIERQDYKKHFCLMITICIAQVLGCFIALGFGFMLRVTMTEPDNSDKLYFVPD